MIFSWKRFKFFIFQLSDSDSWSKLYEVPVMTRSNNDISLQFALENVTEFIFFTQMSSFKNKKFLYDGRTVAIKSKNCTCSNKADKYGKILFRL